MKISHVALTLVGVASLSVSSHAIEKPNVIVIFTDDHGYADLSCQGSVDDIRTPHIDALARGGTRMTSGYVTAPQCVPSRAGLLTGRYQNRFGVESNGEPLEGFNAQQTLAERLQQAGYATGMAGKWHLGPPHEITRHGFDDVYCNQGGPNRVWSNFDLDGNSIEGANRNDNLYHLDSNSAAACAFIRRHQTQPFFFYCAYRAPHVPLDAPPKYLKRFPGEMPERRRQALAMISAIDDGVGQIVSTLRDCAIEERTLIFLLGDNGAPLKIHKLDAPGGGPGWDGSLNDPLNGEKGMLTEGGIRVPWLAYWKGHIPAGQVYDHPVISLDLAASAVALAGLPDDAALDGVNLIPYLSGELTGEPHQALYWRWIAQSAIREGKWKYLRGGTREYLFDLSADREEKQNLLRSHPDVATRLSEQLSAWAGKLQPPGLSTRPMSTTWEQYFDFYLDGKPAPLVTSSKRSVPALQGWVARNAEARLADGALRITPSLTARQRPFLACSGIRISGPASATLTIRTSQTGAAGFAWRLTNQKDFPPTQTVTFDLPGSDDYQHFTTEIPAEGEMIHVRLHLPMGQTDIQRIRIAGQKSRAARQWDFKEE